jgi:integrase
MLTIKRLRARSTGGDEWVSDGAKRGSGALWARIGPSGVSFYFRYSHEGKKKALPLGSHDENGTKGLTLAQARERAGGISRVYQSGITDLHGHVERERATGERALKAEEEAARRAAEDAQRGSLRKLLDAYVGHLVRQGKQSANDVRSIFDLHVVAAVPELLERKAADLSVDDFVDPINRLIGASKGRTAEKLRSYLRAAYQLALESKTDPAAPFALRTFGISVNPVASIGALSQFNRARDRVLSAPELGALLRRLDALPEGPQRDALQLLLLLGGQRPTQLLRAKSADVDLSAATLTLYDPKGRRRQARRHVLPLVKDAAALLKSRLGALQEGEPLFSTDTQSVMRPETISGLVTKVSADMVKEKQARESFQMRDIRRTCETMLASLKVSSDVRAQLQSHGLGGVQNRHYDRHEYAVEKKQALEKWARHLAALRAGKEAAVTIVYRKKRQKLQTS